MKALVRFLLVVGSTLLMKCPLAAQGCLTDFTLFGEAVQMGNCYRLTSQGVNDRRGAMWSPSPISLNQNFDFSFAVTQCGQADGVVFVLQNVGPVAGIGEQGRGIGYYQAGAFARSVGIEMDLFQNDYAPYFDPPYQHMMLALNGDPTPVLGPVAVPGLGNCTSRTLRVRWDAVARVLTVQLDGNTLFTYPQNLVANVFGGNPTVWFGFVGATGGLSSTQTVCPGALSGNVVPAPLLAIDGTMPLCPSDYVVLSATYQPAGSTYTWSPSAGLNTTSGPRVFASPAVTTTYRVNITSPGGCQRTDSVRVTVLPRPSAKVSTRQVVCPGASAALSTVSVEPGATHLWSPATGLNATTGEKVVATPAVTTQYTVATTAPGFCTRHDTVTVVVRPRLQLRVSPPTQAVPNRPTVLTASSSVATATYAWAPGTGLSATTGAEVTAAPLTTTTYTVTATGPGGCTEQATVLVQPFVLPNVITPNGDHLNDSFRPLVSLGPVTLQVYSRWGKLVFEQAPYQGNWSADNLAAGSYYYRLSNAQGNNWKGWVDVVR